ncbi:uncharacterized protein LOC143276048 [Babylonia areolata]|uniref:uncharacterized protein LOC143276048 n=1 Tax=Babylonia areolata TaxID=304850 RepID=UPI003FD47F34
METTSQHLTCEEEAELLNSEEEEEGWLEGRSVAFTLILSLYAVIGLVGNSVVVAVYGRQRRGGGGGGGEGGGGLSHCMHIFILAVVDLVVCCVVIPYTVCFERRLVTWDPLCRGLEVLRHTLVNVSNLMLLVIAARRYLSIFYPWRHRTARGNRVTIAVIFVLGAVAGFPAAAVFTVTSNPHGVASSVSHSPTQEMTPSQNPHDVTSSVAYNPTQEMTPSPNPHDVTSSVAYNPTQEMTPSPNPHDVTSSVAYNPTQEMTPSPNPHDVTSSEKKPCPEHAYCRFTTALLGETGALLYQSFLAAEFFVTMTIIIILYIKVYRQAFKTCSSGRFLEPRHEGQPSPAAALPILPTLTTRLVADRCSPATLSNLPTVVVTPRFRVREEERDRATTEDPKEAATSSCEGRDTRKAATMLVICTLIYILTWLPFWVDIFRSGTSLLLRYTFLVAHATNPLVYGIVNARVRQEIRKLFFRS